MAVGVANHSFPIRKTDNARGGYVIDGHRAIRPTCGMAITQQLDMRRLERGIHRQDVDLDAIEVIERSLRRSLVECTLAGRQPAVRIEPLARRDVGDRNCAVIDPRCTFAAP